MNARRYCVVIALTGVADCVGDLMAGRHTHSGSPSQAGLGLLDDK
jgi:hypothetical protein